MTRQSRSPAKTQSLGAGVDVHDNVSSGVGVYAHLAPHLCTVHAKPRIGSLVSQKRTAQFGGDPRTATKGGVTQGQSEKSSSGKSSEKSSDASDAQYQREVPALYPLWLCRW